MADRAEPEGRHDLHDPVKIPWLVARSGIPERAEGHVDLDGEGADGGQRWCQRGGGGVVAGGIGQDPGG